MAGSKISKNLPKRTTNTKAQERRHRSWTLGQARSKQRQEANQQRHKDNLKRIANGELTPWQAAKEKAKQRRAALKSTSKDVAKTRETP